MSALTAFSAIMDRISTLIGRFVMWLVLLTTLISAFNALRRYIFSASSNALLEIQWYLFAAVFMLGAGYVFLQNAHVRIDVLSSRLSARTRNWIDVVGIVGVVIPMCVIIIGLSWPWFMRAFVSGEVSSNAGGLIRWPIYLLIPLGMALLLLQSVSELIKRVAFLRGEGPDTLAPHEKDEERLAHEMQEELEAHEAERRH